MIEHVSCPLCERRVDCVRVVRNYFRRGINVTIWVHPAGERCTIIDDHYEDERFTGKPGVPFEIIPIEKDQSDAGPALRRVS